MGESKEKDVKKPKKGKNKVKDESEEPEKPVLPPVPYFSLYRYASTTDKILLFLGAAAAVGSGFSMPLMTIYFGRITDTMVGQSVASPEDYYTMCNKYISIQPPYSGTSTTDPWGTTFDPDETPSTEASSDDAFVEEVTKLALIMVYIGIGTWILNFVFISTFNIVSENQIFRTRRLYLEALLRQNVGWYDTVQDKNFVSRIAEDLVKMEEATGEKVGLCIYFMATFFLSIGNAFYHGWKMTLVVLCSAPALAIAASIVASIQSRVAKSEQDSYAKAGTVAQEAITNIKTVMAFSGAPKEAKRYEEGLADSIAAGKTRGAVSSFGMGLMWLIIYASYALAFWYGVKLIIEGREAVCKGDDPEYGPDNMITVFFSVLMGAFNIGQSASYFEAFATGRGAAATIFDVIDRIPEIDSYSEKGKKPSGRAKGRITFKDVNFCYPSRPDIQILKNFNLSVEPGQTVALVGHSGCGKSTCIQLLQRFYDPLSGAVTLDGEDITDLHIGWLRSQIGVVSQEPILFNTTIAENIRYGRDDVTQKEIEEACKQSNAHSFISKLPSKYETLVGDRGAALSGGQKQRIAIARSLVRNPAILLLDEATSALDTQSEAIVQAALDNARLGRTTLIVAHRLSTIRNADVVVAINDGQVQEQGTHHELLKKKGLYHGLVLAQMQGRGEDLDLDSIDEEVDGNEKQTQPRSMYPVPRGSVISMEDEETVVTPLNAGINSLSEKELAKQAPISRLLKMNMKEWPYILIGTIAAGIQGSVMPVYAVIFGEVMKTLGEPDEEEAQRQANTYSLYFLGIGLIAGVSMFLQSMMFSIAGESLTQRLRKLTFAAMLRQELGWFDEPSNNIGSLCARLAGDSASVQGATGSRIGILVQAVSTITIAICLAMYYKAKLGAVALAFVPLVLVATYFQGLMLFGANVGEKKAVEESSKIATQAVSNIRTVAQLCKERTFVQMYTDLLQDAHDATFRINIIRGFVFGFSQSVVFFAYAAINYYGAELVEKENMPYGDIFKVSQSLIMGTMMVGQSLAMAPNYNKAKISAARVLGLLDRRPAIENSPGVGLQIKSSNGEVKFEQTAFHYPTRPSAKILKSLSMAVQPGTSVALVGPSGCGKSTTIQLILRFYDPISGTVRLDNQDVAALQVDSLRSQMAIVAQEPALFDRTIAENIAYGDNSRNVSMDEIIASAKMANIHNFIAGLPAGYETRVGEMGTQLSGGQKQRVAIARALVRNPKILLLDEATSALDTESEQVVQAALDKASTGRTSITIAHRLSSIQGVDKIIVINHGEVDEQGTHLELLEKRGLYHRLWNMQGSQK